LMSGELIVQIRQAVVPYLMQVIQELPLPPVKGTASSAVGKFDYDLDNIYAFQTSADLEWMIGCATAG